MRRLHLALLAGLIVAGADVDAQDKVLKDLAAGRQVSLSGKKSPIGKALARIAKQAKVDVKCVDQFGREDKKAAKEVVAIEVRKGEFWTVLAALCAAGDLVITEIEDGAVEVTANPSDFEKVEPAGEAVVAGAFRVVPVMDGNEIELRVLPEPWMAPPTMRDVAIALTDADGKRIELETWGNTENTNYNGWFDLSLRLPDDMKEAQGLELSAHVDVPLDLKPITSPPLAELLPKPIAVGPGTLRPIATELREGSMRFRFELLDTQVEARHLALRIEGTPLPTDSFSDSTAFGYQTAEATFVIPEGLDAKIAQLELDVPKFDTIELGRLGDLKGKKTAAGLGTVEVIEVQGGDQARVRLKTAGGLIPWNKVNLVDASGARLDPGRSSSSEGDGADITLFVDSGEMSGKLDDLKLVVDAAISFERHVVTDFAASCAKPFTDDLVQALILSAGPSQDPDRKDALEVRIEITGPHIEVDSAELLKGRKAMRRSSWSSSGSAPQNVLLSYEKSAAPKGGNLDACRLRLEVPKKVVRHELKATLGPVVLRR